MLSYFKNKDFNTYMHGVMVFSIGLAYNCVYEYSKYFGITWVDIPAGSLLRHRDPPLTPEPTIIYIFLLFFIPTLFFSLKNCIKRIKIGKIHWKTGIKDWLKTLFAYAIAFLAFLVFFPLIGHTLRGW